MIELTDEQCIEVYDKLGHEWFNHGSYEKLKEWGNSEERIKQIKIESVHTWIKLKSNAIIFFSTINETLGGVNKI